MLMTFIDPGMLRTPLDLQSSTDVMDGQGGVSQNWTTVATLFAHMEPVSAKREVRGRAREANITHKVTIRHREDIKNDMRLLRNGRTLMIHSVHDLDETSRYLICRCEEIKR
jgi:SPP1 family predicted phage head-tail adaptor